MLQAHYRSILDFSDDAIVAAEKGYKRLMEAMHSLKDISASAKALLIFLLGNNCVMMR
jgi:cysteinyl-tRNA synthetase